MADSQRLAERSTVLAHEWLAPHGGSENVFEQLAITMPGARLQCLWNDAPERFGPEVSETWLASTPLRRSKAAALPFLSAAWRTVSLGDAERVVASSHAFGHHLAARAAREGRESFAYVHTPARYVWDPALDQRGDKVSFRAASEVLKRYDRSRTHAGVSYAANSHFVRRRIQDAWDRDAVVIYPPVPVERLQSTGDWAAQVPAHEHPILEQLPPSFVLGASRVVAYKRLDVAVRVGKLLGLPVVIAGDGPQLGRLRRMAAEVDVPVRFVGRVSDPLLYTLYQRSTLFAFMAVEDFGIMPVEAMALGTPVLVNSVGGAIESVRLARGGAAVDPDAGDAEVRSAALDAISRDSDVMLERSRYFGEEQFRDRIVEWIATQPGDAQPSPSAPVRAAVSVLMPVKNGEPTVVEAVESVVADLGQGDELVVIDDSSTDNTRAAIAALSGPIRVVANNGTGIVDALNTGLRLASGTYIARCDADDSWEPSHVEILMRTLEQTPEAIAAFGGATLLSPGGDTRGESLPPPSSRLGRELLRSNPLVHGTVLASAEAIRSVGGYRNYRGAEDYDLWMRLHRVGAIVTTDRVVYRYRLSDPGTHRVKRRRQARSTLRILLRHAVLTGEVSLYGVLRNAASAVWSGRRSWYRA